MSIRIGNARIDCIEGYPPVYQRPHRFEWWESGHAEVTNEQAEVLRSWDGTTLEQTGSRESKLYADGRLLAVITTDCNCSG